MDSFWEAYFSGKRLSLFPLLTPVENVGSRGGGRARPSRGPRFGKRGYGGIRGRNIAFAPSGRETKEAHHPRAPFHSAPRLHAMTSPRSLKWVLLARGPYLFGRDASPQASLFRSNSVESHVNGITCCGGFEVIGFTSDSTGLFSCNLWAF